VPIDIGNRLKPAVVPTTSLAKRPAALKGWRHVSAPQASPQGRQGAPLLEHRREPPGARRSRRPTKAGKAANRSRCFGRSINEEQGNRADASQTQHVRRFVEGKPRYRLHKQVIHDFRVVGECLGRGPHRREGRCGDHKVASTLKTAFVATDQAGRRGVRFPAVVAQFQSRKVVLVSERGVRS
jgi:hypothetical protein